ncbi:LytR/AlgR family response regulator transcription factor [Spongiimicrobium salis]|uniref:LytR/AlgR family response regulator transcription factor n=1 Tax=Spongiimicrobium salis TaxID=1667022 RepID=UPI00374DDB23
MRILIIEDITLVAERIADLTKEHLPNAKVTIAHRLEEAQIRLREEVYDLLFLDLNLNGKNGFELLRSSLSTSFQTIIITANKEEALAAFDFGVLDFISKPISEKRFEMAISRFLEGPNAQRKKTQSLTVKSKGVVQLIPIAQIRFIRASGNYSEIHTSKKNALLHDKNLEKLLKLLPEDFIRIHRSYIVPKTKITKVLKHGGGKYSIALQAGEIIPLSREAYKIYFKEEA